LALVVIAIVYLIGRSSLSIALRVPRNRAVVGEPAVGEIVIENAGRVRALGLTVEIPVGQGLAAVALPAIRIGATFTHEFAIPTAR
ncbi:hypothetical protein LW959_17900, partial [Erwinia amylovora]|uniref:hypothetical protein n=1 Tax=Erwinia amylovora TaxID=552 RepID=UPI0020BED496